MNAKDTTSHLKHPEGGAALMTVLVFALVFSIMGLAFLTLSGYEIGASIYRDASSQAFLAADAGIEAAKAQFFKDVTWRTGFPSPGDSLGTGRYVVRVVDTTYNGQPAVVLDSHGYVENARRDVFVVGDARVLTNDLAIYARNKIKVQGNASINGKAHADGCFAEPNGDCLDDNDMRGDGDKDGRCADEDCTDQFSQGFQINPPRAYTEPDSFPNCTYYYVKTSDPAGPPPMVAEILDRNGNPFPTPRFITNKLQKAGSKYTYHLSPADLDTTGPYDPTPGVDHHFPIDPGDVSVVINFAQFVMAPLTTVDLKINAGGANPSIWSTIINSRFTGVSVDDRLDHTKWQGGDLELQTDTVFEPLIGITMIVHDFTRINADAVLGSNGACGLTYVTHDFELGNGNAELHGTLICLHDVKASGTADLNWNPCFITKAPRWAWDVSPGTSGIFHVLLWKEPPVGN